ncbi:MAG: RNA-dependent RNA polymerase [Sanya polycipivirus 1]|nr:MAG: RNA-dependent RNA polymerase [Sanya polycipivirus 1]
MKSQCGRNSYHRGVFPRSTVYAFPKDELRSVEKNRQGKTRAIMCCTMPMNLCIRMYFAEAFGLMHYMAPTAESPCMVGINPESSSSRAMYIKLMKHDRFCGMDVSAWDASLSQELFLAACDVINALYADEHAYARRTLMLGIVHSYVQVDEHLYWTHQGMKSGAACVAEMNTLCHWIVVLNTVMREINRLGLHHLNNWRALKEVITFYVYGDDIVMSVSSDFPTINGELFVKAYKDFGFTVTDATNKGATPAFVNDICGMTFLKRRFGFNPMLPGVPVLKIEEQVIENLLCHVKKGSMPEEEQLKTNILTALCYAWLHGPDIFAKWFNISLGLDHAFDREKVAEAIKTFYHGVYGFANKGQNPDLTPLLDV